MGRVPYIRYPLSLCGKARFGKAGLFYMNRQEERQTEQEIREKEDRGLKEYGQMTLEDDDSIDGMLVLLNTSGGDVDAGLAIAEMIASMSIPVVSLVLGGSHSIGVPLAVSSCYSFIVPSGTMMVHPVRMTGMVIGTERTYDYFQMIQDRILTFVSEHSAIAYDKLHDLMHNTEMLTRDLGTVLVGKEAVDVGLIDAVGGIKEALAKLYEMIDERKNPAKQ